DGAGTLVSATSLSSWGTSGNTANITFSNGAAGSLGTLSLASNTSSGTVATANVLTGADVTSNSLDIAFGSGTNEATLTLDGVGSSWTIAGAGTLNIGSNAGAGI